MAAVSMRDLLDAGVHFGHQTRYWSPAMAPYIFGARQNIHIINLEHSLPMLRDAMNVLGKIAAKGGTVLFVGTKKQAAASLQEAAERCGMPYVVDRWLGGMLTNWQTMRQRVATLLDLESRRDRGEFAMLSKREQLTIERKIEKLNKRLGGIKHLHDLPDIMYVVDTRREHLAVGEANKLKVPIAAIVDTNCDPDPITYVIPSNDDAIRALKLITDKIADAIIEGRTERESTVADEGPGEDVDTSKRVYDPFEDEGRDDDED